MSSGHSVCRPSPPLTTAGSPARPSAAARPRSPSGPHRPAPPPGLPRAGHRALTRGNRAAYPALSDPPSACGGGPAGPGRAAPGRVAAVGLQVPWRPAAAGGAGGGRGAAPRRRRGQLYPGLWRFPVLSRRRPLRGGGSMCARRGAAPVPAPRLLLFPPPPWTPTPSSRPCGVPWIRRCGKPPRGSLTR